MDRCSIAILHVYELCCLVCTGPKAAVVYVVKLSDYWVSLSKDSIEAKSSAFMLGSMFTPESGSKLSCYRNSRVDGSQGRC